MALTREELAQRIKAAREALGLEQKDLTKLLRDADEGFGKTDVGRMERPNGKAPPPMNRPRAEALSRHTGFPPEWFTEPDISQVFGSNAPEPSAVDQLRAEFQEELEALRVELLEEIGSASGGQSSEQPPRARDEEDQR